MVQPGPGRVQARRLVGDERQPHHRRPCVHGGHGLEHRGHAHQVGAEDLRHANLGRRLVGGAEETGVHALVQLGRHRADPGPQLGVVGHGHVGEAGAEAGVVGADERGAAGEVQVIGDQHRLPHGQVGPHAAGGVGEHDRATPGDHRGAHRVHDLVGVVALVQVDPTVEHQHPASGEIDRGHLRAVAVDRGRRKAAQRLGVEVGHRAPQGSRIPPARPQHHGHVVGVGAGEVAEGSRRARRRVVGGGDGIDGRNGQRALDRWPTGRHPVWPTSGSNPKVRPDR